MGVLRVDRVNKIIRRAYGTRYDLLPREITRRRQYYFDRVRRGLEVIMDKRSRIILFVLIAVLSGGIAYYYNLLVTQEQDVLAARGKVSALLQRRNDISINLSKAVLDYSRHEQGVFTAVVSLRSFLSENGMKPSDLEAISKRLERSKNMVKGEEAGTNPLNSLASLLAVAEQYPDLKLAGNFQSLMTALTDVEKDLAGQRIKYNDAVNMYTTSMTKFPINIVAKIFGFPEWPYFEATEEAKSLKPIAY